MCSKTQTFTIHCFLNGAVAPSKSKQPTWKWKWKSFSFRTIPIYNLQSPQIHIWKKIHNLLNWCSLLDVIWCRNELNSQLTTYNVRNIHTIYNTHNEPRYQKHSHFVAIQNINTELIFQHSTWYKFCYSLMVYEIVLDKQNAYKYTIFELGGIRLKQMED